MLENTVFIYQMGTDLALRVTVLVEETRNWLFFASLRFKSKFVFRGKGLHKSLELQISLRNVVVFDDTTAIFFAYAKPHCFQFPILHANASEVPAADVSTQIVRSQTIPSSWLLSTQYLNESHPVCR
jgi:hypothetical protein